jgi:hypothetical protein
VETSAPLSVLLWTERLETQAARQQKSPGHSAAWTWQLPADFLLHCTQNRSQDRQALGHEPRLRAFKTLEFIQRTFSDHNGIKLDVSNSREFGKFTNTRKLNILLNNQSKMKKYSEEMRNKNTPFLSHVL